MKRAILIDTPTVCDETRLISLIVSGEKALFYELIRPYEHRLRRVALALVRNDADADDVVQETLLKAFLNLSRFRAEARLSTWLTTIALNEAKSHLRRRGLRAFEPIDADSGYCGNWREHVSSPYMKAEEKQFREMFLRAIAGLHPRYRNIYVLREVHEVSTQEAARQLGISMSVAKMRLHRARHLLRDRLTTLMHAHDARRSCYQGTDESIVERSIHAA
jgi:RNA polymerase sigma-70 factor (ECF subfamily)